MRKEVVVGYSEVWSTILLDCLRKVANKYRQ
jgi:hypothetical protein